MKIITAIGIITIAAAGALVHEIGAYADDINPLRADACPKIAIGEKGECEWPR